MQWHSGQDSGSSGGDGGGGAASVQADALAKDRTRCTMMRMLLLLPHSSVCVLSRSVKHLQAVTMATTASASASSPIKQAKKKLRSEIDAKLRQLTPNEVVHQSKQVHSKLFALTEFQAAKRVGLYLSLPSVEVDTVGILEHCFAQGKQCFVPKYQPKSRVMQFVQLTSMADYEALPVEPKWKIKQPDPSDDNRMEALSTGGLDILLMPGVAFTRDGLRLGHGMGYFDTWLAKCAQTANIQQPVTVALALSVQVVDDLPHTEWDVRINRLIAP